MGSQHIDSIQFLSQLFNFSSLVFQLSSAAMIDLPVFVTANTTELEEYNSARVRNDSSILYEVSAIVMTRPMQIDEVHTACFVFESITFWSFLVLWFNFPCNT